MRPLYCVAGWDIIKDGKKCYNKKAFTFSKKLKPTKLVTLMILQEPAQIKNKKMILVVISIEYDMHEIANMSHVAYAKRHGYIYVNINSWKGLMDRPVNNSRSPNCQKLLACTASRPDEDILIIDADVVIAPWAPPVPFNHRKIHFADQMQPDRSTHLKIMQYWKKGKKYTSKITL